MGIASDEIGEIAEIDPAAALRGAKIINVAVHELSAETQRVSAGGVGDGIGPILGFARRRLQRPTGVATHVVEGIRARVDAGHAKQRGVGDPSVDPVGCGVDVVIQRENRLTEAVETVSRFVDPGRVGRPDPVHAENLSRRLCSGEPVGADRDCVHLDEIAVAVEISGAQHVMIVEVIVSLENQVVPAIGVVEIEINCRRVGWLQG